MECLLPVPSTELEIFSLNTFRNIAVVYRTRISYRTRMVHTRGETIRVNAVLRIVFDCIAIYCHIAIFDWIMVIKTFYMGIWVLAVKKRIYTLYNCIKA